MLFFSEILINGYSFQTYKLVLLLSLKCIQTDNKLKQSQELYKIK